jgi:hypothetical protein
MKRPAFDAASRSVDELRRELEQLDAEIRQARSHEVGPVIDRILKTMTDWSISLAELERYRRTRGRRASDTWLFRDPVTGETWSVKDTSPERFAQDERRLGVIPADGPIQRKA